VEQLMNERQRMAYLDAMGVSMFVPRWILPSAAISRQALLPQPVAGEEFESQLDATHLSVTDASPTSLDQRSRAGSTQPVMGVVSGIIGELASKESSRAKSATTPEKRAVEEVSNGSPARAILNALAGADAQAKVRFSLSLWRVNDNLLVIDSHQARQALPTTTLLSNILFAKGIVAPLASAEVLHWPMLASSSAGGGGWSEASEMVLAFLRARFERQPAQYLWLMGEAAFRAVCVSDDEYHSSIGQMRDLGGLGCMAVVLPSLADMLTRPELKAPTWQAIKAHKLG
jgi:hypothetical protein